MGKKSELPIDYFVVANEVRITDPASGHYGRKGEISIYDTDASEEEPPYRVTFDRELGDEAWFFADEMELVE